MKMIFKGIKIPTCREIDNKRTLSAPQVLYCLCSTVFRLITFFIMNKGLQRVLTTSQKGVTNINKKDNDHNRNIYMSQCSLRI